MSAVAAPHPSDLSTCDSEPIHMPGAIQPHGVLLLVSEPELTVLMASANTREHFGVHPEALLGRDVSGLFDERAVAALRESRGSAALRHLGPIASRIAERDVLAVLHRSDGALVIEIEPVPSTTATPRRDIHTEGQVSVERFLQAESVPQLCNAIVEEIRRLFGYDRVMVYRFDEDGHGEVLAEARAAHMDSFLGLHYPASDIPLQARRLYVQSRIRNIPDATYPSVPLVPAANPLTGLPLDLGQSFLRSVSPIHLEYLANMGVRASLSISLVEKERLWGLVACHHATPKFVPYPLLVVAEFLGQVLSWILEVRQARDDDDQRIRARRVRSALVDQAASTANLFAALLLQPTSLQNLVGAGGVALVIDGIVETRGRTPTPRQISRLVDWLRPRIEGGIFATTNLREAHELAAEYSHVASGLLAIAFPAASDNFVLWFRPEVVRTVAWAGDPTKPVGNDRDGDPPSGHRERISPRKSFARWQEIVKNCSLRWAAWEIEAATELRSVLTGMVLRNAAEIARVRVDLSEEIRSREHMLAIASHEFRSPLQTILLASNQLLEKAESKLELASDQLITGLLSIERAGERLERLVSDVLDVSRVRAGRLDLVAEKLDLSRLLVEVVARLQDQIARAGCDLVLESTGAVVGFWDRTRIDQVITNLLTNAMKYGAHHPIVVRLARAPEATELSIRDHGIGVLPEDRRRIFEPFERAVSARPYGGTGLGLWIARQIVEAHGGSIRVDDAPGGGAEFIVELPYGGPTEPRSS